MVSLIWNTCHWNTKQSFQLLIFLEPDDFLRFISLLWDRTNFLRTSTSTSFSSFLWTKLKLIKHFSVSHSWLDNQEDHLMMKTIIRPVSTPSLSHPEARDPLMTPLLTLIMTVTRLYWLYKIPYSVELGVSTEWLRPAVCLAAVFPLQTVLIRADVVEKSYRKIIVLFWRPDRSPSRLCGFSSAGGRHVAVDDPPRQPAGLHHHWNMGRVSTSQWINICLNVCCGETRWFDVS